MPTPLSKAAERAVKLLDKRHPKFPHRCYTITEAAAKAGVARTTLYRHIKRLDQSK